VVRAASHVADHGAAVYATGIYRRRRPERTLAWQTVQGWLATWLAHHEDLDAESVPAYVQRELSAYLECLNPGAQFRAGTLCGLYRGVPGCILVQGPRGVCPSYTSEGMAATAAHLIDSVIPHPRPPRRT